MAQLAIDKEFLGDYSRLPEAVQSSVKAPIDKFAEHIHARLRQGKLSRSKDNRIRAIRVDQFWRGLIFAPNICKTSSLLRVLPHHKAIEYAAGARSTGRPA